MSAVLNIISLIENEIQLTESWCDSYEDRKDAELKIARLIIELEMEIELARNGDYDSRLSRLKSSVSKMFEAENLSCEKANFYREGAIECLFVLKRAGKPMPH